MTQHPVNISIQYLGLESKGARCLRTAKTWHQYNQQIWASGATYIKLQPEKKHCGARGAAKTC